MTRVLVVFHPCSGGRSRRETVDALCAELAAAGHVVEKVETLPAGQGDGPVRARIGGDRWDHVVAAGGDGTLRDVAEALLELPAAGRPSLAVVALGTANNAARAIDPTLARRVKDPSRHLLAALATPSPQPLDVGRANGRIFLGSVALGMDADILAWRNAARARCPAALAGYPLYLASCAANALRPHGGPVSATRDGQAWAPAPARMAVNVLVTNTALHAGEFRFAAGVRHRDGLLDVVWNPTMADYLRRYAAAWPRHVRASCDRPVRDDPGLVSTERLALEWRQPLAWQIDGEEMPPTDRFEITCEPGALTVLVPTRA